MGNFSELIKLDDEIDEKKTSQRPIELSLAETLKLLVVSLTNITEFSMRDLVPLSMLAKHKYIKPYLQILVLNKKHIKRKHSKELLQAIKDISNTIHIGIPLNNEKETIRYRRD